MTTVFADTYVWIALANPRDSAHQQAIAVSRSLRGTTVITTEEVLVEVLTFFAEKGRHLRAKAVQVVRGVLSDANARVIEQSHESFLAGLDLYEERLDKGYSLPDCISMNTMRAEGITDILTNDEHFTQEGFHALFRA